MDAFLRRYESAGAAAFYDGIDRRWNDRAGMFNARLAAAGLPVRIAHLSSIWTVDHLAPSRYNWMLQYYLRAEGLALSWVGTGRIIFSLDYSDDDIAEVADRFLAGCEAMRRDGWWWTPEGATDRSVRRGMMRELLRRRGGARAQAQE